MPPNPTQRSGADAATDEVVLVTGFPRLVARRVTEGVLAESAAATPGAPRRVVRLLVPARHRDEALEFVAHSRHGDRITLLEGEASAIDLGLSGQEFRALAAEVDYIQHHAAVTGEGEVTDARALYAANVQAAREVLELGRAAAHLKRVVHHSSARVAGDRTGVVREEELEAGQAFRSPVEETLFKAERLMRRAMDAVPVTVARPGIEVGDSRTGEVDRLDGPYLLVLLILNSPAEISLPMPSRGDASLNLVPADYVARASVALMSDPGAAGRTFHLVDPTPLPARRVYELIASAAGRKLPRGFIPVNITRALLRTPGLDRVAQSPRAFLEQLATPVTYASQGARDLLMPRKIECPPFESYVDTLVTHVRERLAARRARRAGEGEHEVEDPLA